MGVVKGDRVTIYMGRVPELVFAMLACARLGAIHSVVFGGFSVEALHERLEDSKSKVLIVSDGSYVRGKIVDLKGIADEALARAATVEHVVVVKNGHDINMEAGVTTGITTLRPANGQSGCEAEVLDAEDPLFSSTPREPPASPRQFSTPTAATWWAPMPP